MYWVSTSVYDSSDRRSCPTSTKWKEDEFRNKEAWFGKADETALRTEARRYQQAFARAPWLHLKTHKFLRVWLGSTIRRSLNLPAQWMKQPTTVPKPLQLFGKETVMASWGLYPTEQFSTGEHCVTALRLERHASAGSVDDPKHLPELTASFQ